MPSWEIRECTTESDFDCVAKLFREYAEWLQVDLCFQDFENELASLPGKYATPLGIILIAYCDGVPAGCVGVRPFHADAELKRLYVRPSFRGIGIGADLLQECIKFARSAGYRSIVLDTLSRLTSAGKLYQAYGFEKFSNYNETDLDGIEFYRLSLETAG